MIRRSQLDMSVAAPSGSSRSAGRLEDEMGSCRHELWGRKMHRRAFFHWNVLSSRSVPGFPMPYREDGHGTQGPTGLKSSHVCLSSSFWQEYNEYKEKRKRKKAKREKKKAEEEKAAKKAEPAKIKKARWNSKKGLIFWFGWMVFPCFFWVVVFLF